METKKDIFRKRRLMRCLRMDRLALRMSLIFVLLSQIAWSQDFMMQAYYWDYPKTTDGYNWADTLISHADELDDAGITFVSLPPLARAHSGNSSNGYDPMDLFDYGEFGGGATGFGTRTDLDNVIDTFSTYGIKTVGDLILNHRDGGEYENNPALETYDTNYDYSSGDRPYPYDRYRVILPIGGSTGNGAGDYYFKVKSRSPHADFTGVKYSFYVETNKIGNQSSSDNESEPNGGLDCTQDSDTIQLGVLMNAENYDYDDCWTDEFLLQLSASDFNSGGDTMYITFGKWGDSDYSDMYIYGLYSSVTTTDIVSQLKYQTATKFSNMPSGRGEMDFEYFKPNSSRPSDLSGDQDSMLFYLDYDQYQSQTYDTLHVWAKWNWSDVGMRGFRMDAVKHYPPEFVGDLFDYLHGQSIDPTLVVGEFYSAATNELGGWITDVKGYMDAATQAAITPRVYDFSLRDNLRQACDDASFDVRNVFVSGVHDVEGTSGENIVTFVNNHDFRGQSDFESLIQNDPMLAYAYILTNNQVGLPTIFYPDYFGYQGSETYYPSGANAAAHGDEMKKLIEIHKRHIYGDTTSYYLNKSGSGYSNDCSDNTKVLVYQLETGPSGKAVVVAINFGSGQVQFHQQLHLGGALAVGNYLTDILGNSANDVALINSSENGISNEIWIDLPARSYGIWIEGAKNDVTPLRPSHLTLDTISETSVTLTWTDNSNNEDGFKILAKPKGGSFAQLGSTTSADVTTFTFSGLAQDTEYEFQVKASNAKGDSESANTVTDRTWVRWDGSSDAVWATAANWGSGSAVSAASKIIIPDVSTDPKIGSAAVCQHLKIESGGHLEISPTYSLTVSGNLYNLAGNSGIVVKSDATGTGSLITMGEVGGGGTVERYFPALSGKGDKWYLVSPPITDATANVFFDEYLQYWDEENELYVSIEEETTPLHSGQGYANKKTQDQTETFEGKLGTGNMTAPDMRFHSGQANASAPEDYSGWNLMGNPYPSAIDWNQVSIPAHMGIGVSVWDEAKSGGRGWYQYNHDGSGDTEARYIGIGQGFFVLIDQDHVNLSFENTDRTHTQASNFYKSATASACPFPQLVMTTSDHNYSNSSYIVFKEGTSDTVNIAEDCIKFFSDGVIPHVYSMVGEKNLAINEIPPPEIDDTVHLGFRTTLAGSYKLKFNGIQSLNPEWPMYVQDKVSGEIYDIRQDSVMMFSYQNTDPENRFDMFFDDLTVSNELSHSSAFSIFSYGKSVFIRANRPTTAQIRIFDILGQEVYSSHDLSAFNNGKELLLPSAVYVVEVCSEDNCSTAKIFLK